MASRCQPALFGHLDAMIYSIAQQVIDGIREPINDGFIKLRLAPGDFDGNGLAEFARQSACQSRGACEGLCQRHHAQFDQALFKLKKLALDSSRAVTQIELIARAEFGSLQETICHCCQSLHLDG